MSTTTKAPTLADAIRAAIDDLGLSPENEQLLRAALPRAEAADALAEAADELERRAWFRYAARNALASVRAALRRYRGQA